MDCLLHIGTEKTATTTLQAFLHENRSPLYERGFIYTHSAGEKNNRALAVAAFNAERRDTYTRSKGLNSNEDLLSHQREIIAQLTNEIQAKANSSSEQKLIFSSEHIQSRLTTLEELQRLKAILCNFGASRFQVILYLRNPTDTATSLFSTNLKSGGIRAQPQPPGHPYYRTICDHKTSIERFSAVFGKDAIIPRLFTQEQLHKGSIIEDFLQVAGIGNMQDAKFPSAQNERLSQLGVEILRRVNRIMPANKDGTSDPSRRELSQYISKFCKAPPYEMPAERKAEYQQYYAASNEWVRQHYFPQLTTLFSDNARAQEDALQFSNKHLDNLAWLIVAAWRHTPATQKRAP